jgi:hypothetical protein
VEQQLPARLTEWQWPSCELYDARESAGVEFIAENGAALECVLASARRGGSNNITKIAIKRAASPGKGFRRCHGETAILR